MSWSQKIDFDGLANVKVFKVNGGVSANSVFYKTNNETPRNPFTYFLQGNLNFSIYDFNVPLSYSFSNQGSNLSYQLPFKFNRLSLQPKFKWIQGYIGDVSMSFSPYTLNGHQFTGVGVELKPKGQFHFSAMSGRLLKSTPENGNPKTIPSFERNGYGGKIMFIGEKINFGLVGFYAKDKQGSLEEINPSKGITPMENLVVSIEGGFQVTKNIEFNAVYSSSALTQDTNAQGVNEGKGIAGSLINNKVSTEVFEAIKASLNLNIGKSRIGLELERIQPGYQSLGTYYFNNDFENITVNFSTILFKKITLSFNGGLQRDDLNNVKENKTFRRVGTLNFNIVFSEKLSLNTSYSNFNTYTNTRLNQFEQLNDDNLLDNQADEFNFTQLSQNASLVMNYILSQKETLRQSLSLNYALAGVSNKQNGLVRIGDASTFHNVNANYHLSFPKRKLNFITAVNSTLNTIGKQNSLTWGPSINANGFFLNKNINNAFVLSYSYNKSKGNVNKITSIRFNTSFQVKKKHNFTLNFIQLIKSASSTDLIKEITFTFGYNYGF